MGEKQQQVKKDILDELSEMMGQMGKETGFSEYTQVTQHHGFSPKNPFDHAYGLIDVRRGKIQDYDDLLNPHLFLGNIEDEKTLKVYQNNMHWLFSMYQLARNDPAMMYVFEPLWYNLLSNIRVTGTLDGSERGLQAFLKPVARARGSKLFGKKKKKQEPMEYIVPEEPEDEGMF